MQQIALRDIINIYQMNLPASVLKNRGLPDDQFMEWLHGEQRVLGKFLTNGGSEIGIISWCLLNLPFSKTLESAIGKLKPGPEGRPFFSSDIPRKSYHAMLHTGVPLFLIANHDWLTRLGQLRENLQNGCDHLLLHLLNSREDGGLIGNSSVNRLALISIHMLSALATGTTELPGKFCDEGINPLLMIDFGNSSLSEIDMAYRNAFAVTTQPELHQLLLHLEMILSYQAIRLAVTGMSMDDLREPLAKLVAMQMNDPDGDFVSNAFISVFEKYNALNQALRQTPIPEPDSVMGTDPLKVYTVNGVDDWQLGFVREGFGEKQVASAFGVNPFSRGMIFRDGVTPNYIKEYSYRSDPAIWINAVERLEAYPGNDLAAKVVRLQHPEEVPDIATQVCKKLFIIGKKTDYVRPVLPDFIVRCCKAIPGLSDQVYLAANDVAKLDKTQLLVLAAIGTPSRDIIHQLNSGLRQLSIRSSLEL